MILIFAYSKAYTGSRWPTEWCTNSKGRHSTFLATKVWPSLISSNWSHPKTSSKCPFYNFHHRVSLRCHKSTFQAFKFCQFFKIPKKFPDHYGLLTNHSLLNWLSNYIWLAYDSSSGIVLNCYLNPLWLINFSHVHAFSTQLDHKLSEIKHCVLYLWSSSGGLRSNRMSFKKTFYMLKFLVYSCLDVSINGSRCLLLVFQENKHWRLL